MDWTQVIVALISVLGTVAIAWINVNRKVNAAVASVKRGTEASVANAVKLDEIHTEVNSKNKALQEALADVNRELMSLKEANERLRGQIMVAHIKSQEDAE